MIRITIKSIAELSIVVMIMFLLSTTAVIAKSNDYWLVAGETKRINVPIREALTIKSVSVGGDGVSTRVVQKFPTSLGIKVVAEKTTLPGKKQLTIQTQSEQITIPLYVFGINAAKITHANRKPATQLHRVDIHMPFSTAMLEVYANKQPHCGAYQSNNPSTRMAIHNTAVKLKRSGSIASIWIGSDITGRKSDCQITISESYEGLDAEVSRNLTLSFDVGHDYF